MKISYNWLATYFDTPLPPPEDLAEKIIFGFAEIDSIETVSDDTIFDIKVLPDRACYALCHRGVAQEVSALFQKKLKSIPAPVVVESAVTPFELKIEASDICTKFVARKIENVQIAPSPQWLVDRMKSIGQKSINNVVDATNFVMFDIGRPLHAFDADKVEGVLVVRRAKKGEKITTLDNKEVIFNETTLVVADDKGPLAIAGIKGGKRAEVGEKTKNLILEGANWDASFIRKTSTKIGIRTDGSKRFENRLSPLLAEEGVDAVTRIIIDTAGGKETKAGKKVVISNETYKPQALTVTAQEISAQLGITVSEKEIIDLLDRLMITAQKEGDAIVVDIPAGRLDLTIPEDITEEVGRIYGYDKIKGILPRNKTFIPQVNKTYYYSEKIKNTLVGMNFSEVYLYVLGNKGEYEVLYPVASDRNYLRTNLTDGLLNCLELNARNADYLGLDTIKIFEIGNVFTKTGEYTSLAIGIKQIKKKKGETVNEQIRNVREALLKELDLELITLCTVDDSGGLIMLEGKQIGTINNVDGILELNLGAITAALPQPISYTDLDFKPLPTIKYEPISAYPYIVRDIALFVPKEVTPEQVTKTLTEEKNNLLVKGPVLFDDFTNKEGKRSLAFRMIYQSFERTLSDAEVNIIMEKVYARVKGKGWEVR